MDLEEKFEVNEEAPTYAPSLPVPNVQEMVRKDALQVPQRYVRDFADRPKDTNMSHLSSLIPVVDLSLLLKGNEEELDKLDLACQEWSFFQVVNHGVTEEVLQKMKDAAAEFFELQLEGKNKYAMTSDDIQGKLKFWPKSPLGFLEIIEEYSNAILKVSMELFQSLSAIMGMDKEALLGLHKQLLQAYRVNYYPPCCKPEQVLGISPHSDSSSITILLQEDHVCGLQIRHKGEWVTVNPIPNALVVNIGDVIEIWSNGKYKSVEHRVVTNYTKPRISHALFMAPHDDAEIEPLNHMLNSPSPHKLYKKVKYGEYLRNSMNRKMEGKAHTKIALVETFG